MIYDSTMTPLMYSLGMFHQMQSRSSSAYLDRDDPDVQYTSPLDQSTRIMQSNYDDLLQEISQRRSLHLSFLIDASFHDLFAALYPLQPSFLTLDDTQGVSRRLSEFKQVEVGRRGFLDE